jgi:hypothetical protein
LDLDEIVGLRVQQPPKKQVAKKTEKKAKAATLITFYTMSPEKKMEPDPVKATFENQVETREVPPPPSNEGFQLWKFLTATTTSLSIHGAQPLMVPTEVPRRGFSGTNSGHGCRKGRRHCGQDHWRNCKKHWRKNKWLKHWQDFD